MHNGTPKVRFRSALGAEMSMPHHVAAGWASPCTLHALCGSTIQRPSAPRRELYTPLHKDPLLAWPELIVGSTPGPPRLGNPGAALGHY